MSKEDVKSLPIAISTGSFYPLTTAAAVQRLGEAGIMDIELTLQQEEFRIDFERRLQVPWLEDFCRKVDSGNLRVRAVHGPHMITELGYSSRARVDYLRKTVEVSKRLGGKVIDVHPFHLCTNYDESIDYLSGRIADVDEILLPGVKEVFDLAQESGIVMGLENVEIWAGEETHFFNTPANVNRFIRDFDHPALGATLDLCHANYSGMVEQFIEELSERCVNMHLADVDESGKRLPPGEGILDWDFIAGGMKQMGELRTAVVEIYDATVERVRKSVDHLSGCLD